MICITLWLLKFGNDNKGQKGQLAGAVASLEFACIVLCMCLAAVKLNLFHRCPQLLMHTHASCDSDVVMSQIKAMADDAEPLLAEVRDSGLLKEVETLTRSLTQASEDLR